jgi:hypothetical protein
MAQLGADWNKYKYTSLFDKTNNNRLLADAVKNQVQGLDPKVTQNFNSLINRFPNQSKDFLLSAAKMGLNAQSEGIEKLASVDGLAQLKQDLTNVDKLKSVASENKGFVNTVKDAVYGGLKGASRVLFATLQAPYQILSASARNAYGLAQGQKDFNLLESTNLGQLAMAAGRSLKEGTPIDTGSGFFIGHDSQVAKAQAKAMQAYGRINDQSFTIGRLAVNSIGVNPNSTPYRVMSGIVDAVLSIGTDPSVWVGPGSVTKIIKGGKDLRLAKEAAQRTLTAKEAKQIEAIKAETALEDARMAEFHGQKKDVIRKVDNNYLKAEKNLKKTKQSQERARVRNTGKQVTYGLERKTYGNAKLEDQLTTDSVGRFVLDTVESGQNQQVINQLAQASADSFNTKGAFVGMHFEDVPEAGKLHYSAFEDSEFIVAISDEKPLDIYDITTTYENATATERAAELERRTAFFEELYRIVDDETLPEVTRNAVDEFIGATTPGNTLQKMAVDDIIFGEGSESVAQLIRRAIDVDNKDLLEIVMDSIQKAWKVDGFSNIRAVHGGTGGVAVTNYKMFTTRLAGISDTLSESLEGRIPPESLGRMFASLRDSDQQLAEAQKNFENAQTAYSAVNRDLKEIEVLQEFVSKDPELLAQIINDPENIGIAKLMGLADNIKSGEYKKEFLRSEVGLLDSFGGSLKGDLKKAAGYVLGKRFAQVADIVARETDFNRMHRFFGRKLDIAMVKELVDATTPEQVISIFLRHLAAPTSDPSVYRSMALRGEAALNSHNPLYKMVAPVARKALPIVEKTERNFGRYFSRSVVLPLDDLDRLINGIEDWMSSAGIPNNIIEDVVNRLAKADSTEIRSGIVFQEIERAQVTIARQIAPGDTAVEEAIKKTFRATGRQNALIKQYVAERLPTNEVPQVAMINGEMFKFNPDQAIFEYQFLDDVVRLPDTRDIKRLVTRYTKNKARFGAERARDVFNDTFGDTWRTAQLAFRAAYIIRNIGEMQFRQYFSGHDTLLNHPLSYLAMIAADSEGGAFRKFLARNARYSKDVLGNSLLAKDVKAQKAFSKGIEAVLNQIGRQHNSNDPRFAFIGRIYEAVTSDQKGYSLALANTIMKAHSDSLIPLVAGVRTVEVQDDFIRALIAGEGKYKGILKTLIEGGRNGVEPQEFARLFLKDSVPVNGVYNLAPENFIVENVKNFIFDVNSTGSVERYIQNVTGTGAGSVYIRDLLAYGKTSVDGEDLLVPSYGAIKENINEITDVDTAFKKSIARIFTTEKMPNATAIGLRDQAFGAEDIKYLDAAVNWFFSGATKAENIVNFAPEAQMAYWDHAARYISMLNDKDLYDLLPIAKEALEGFTIGGKPMRRPIALKVLNAEVKRRKKGKSVTDGITREELDSMAGKKAIEYTKNLFYDAARQRQYANAWRAVFPFAQAQFNTLYKWTQLMKDNPIQFYKLGRAYNALTKEGSSAIYDVTGVEYDDNQGFFYQDEFGETRFRYPLAGSIIGALAGKNIDSAQALQLTAPVQALNLAFGAVNPAVPGIGPAGQILYAASGKSAAFGPEWNFMRQIIFPFGEPQGIQDLIFPAWLKKSFLNFINNDAQVERGIKDWASYLASTGDYGDNPLADDTARTELFNDARGLSRWAGFFTALFQNIAPATPSQEVFAKDKDGMFRTQAMIYNAWDQVIKKHPGDYFKAVAEFSDTFGIKNLLIILGGSTRAVRGTQDAWAFLNNNPEAAEKYATSEADIVPYFFPGGEAATAYYNWQRQAGRRRVLSPEELEEQAQNIVYQMAKSQISEEQAENGYSNVWYTEKMIKLNERFEGVPTVSVRIGQAEARAELIGKALQDPAFKDSPIYEETKTFYDAYLQTKKYLQEVRTTAQPDLSSTFWYTQEKSRELQSLAMQLMIKNPAFSRMYYGVFSGLIETKE